MKEYLDFQYNLLKHFPEGTLPQKEFIFKEENLQIDFWGHGLFYASVYIRYSKSNNKFVLVKAVEMVEQTLEKIPMFHFIVNYIKLQDI